MRIQAHIHYDALTVTIHGLDAREVMSEYDLYRAATGQEPHPWDARHTGKPAFGYLASLDYRETAQPESRRLFRLMWDGNAGVNLRASGRHTPAAFAFLRWLQGRPRTLPLEIAASEVDVAIDLKPGQGISFEELHEYSYKACHAYKDRYGHEVHEGARFGTWELGEPRERTQYYGKRSAAARLKLYEKGDQMHYVEGWDRSDAPKDWIRAEFTFRPQKAARYKVIDLEPQQMLMTSRLAQVWLEPLDLVVSDPVHINAKAPKSDESRAFATMCRQYARVLNWHLARHNGDLAGAYAAMLEEIEHERPA